MRILLIEDDVDVAANIAEYLEPRGAELDFAYDGRRGLELAREADYGVVILDLMLPGLDGIAVCRELRRQRVATPILMLTARDELSQKILGFEAGADDYVVKPFALAELHHRLLALERRGEPPAERVLQVEDLEIETERREVRRGSKLLTLNRMELRILETLARASPAVVSREALQVAVWGDELVATDLLRTYVYRLRRKIDHPFDTPLLHTLHGQGYALRAGGE